MNLRTLTFSDIGFALAQITREGWVQSRAVFYYYQLLTLCMGTNPEQVASICAFPRDKIIPRF